MTVGVLSALNGIMFEFRMLNADVYDDSALTLTEWKHLGTNCKHALVMG
jgi:hypothetical protein